MPNVLNQFAAAPPKQVQSGTSILVNVAGIVTVPPATLHITAQPADYTCVPPSKTYTKVGPFNDELFVIIEGPPGRCVLEGRLGNAKLDVIEVT